MTPEGVAVGGVNAANHTESPYVEGCSPIKSSSPIRPPVRGWAPSSLQLSPKFGPAPEAQNGRRQSGRGSAPPMDVEACPQPLDSSPAGCGPAPCGGKEAGLPELVPMEETGDVSAVNMTDETPTDREDECVWNKDAAGSLPLTSSRTASMFNAESSPMFVSLITEGSSTPYDISMQVRLLRTHPVLVKRQLLEPENEP